MVNSNDLQANSLRFPFCHKNISSAVDLFTVLLLTAASSPQEEFHCAPGALDCQFKPVPETASDEEIFGIHAITE